MRSAFGGFAQTRLAIDRLLALYRRGWLAGFRAFLLILLISAGTAEGAEPRVYLWVVRDALEDSTRFAALADSAWAAGVTDLLVQVRGRGEAYYCSATEPPPRSLETAPPAGTRPGDRPSEVSLRFDPLAAALRVARARDMKLHAWMNVFLSGEWRPAGKAHILTRRPDWRIRARNGKAFDEYGKAERKRLPIEGIYLSPGNPAVREYLATVAAEIAVRYEIDGIHLDYIRYPHLDAGYDEPSLAAFRAARPGARPEGDVWNEWRMSQVGAAVREIARAARAARPGLELTAAVMPDPVDARRSCLQDWPRWIFEGSVDRVITMAYSASDDRLDFWIRVAESEMADPGRVVPGIGLHKASGDAVATLLRVLQARGRREIGLFSDVEFLKDGIGRAAVLRFADAAGGDHQPAEGTR